LEEEDEDVELDDVEFDEDEELDEEEPDICYAGGLLGR